mmetsp:Transcript_72938/g.201301  ORF Transcript_72938/g.201301 Transcript_72938/m.201301 type:complete len:363 (+) Transcript_72938:133-1221(+)
MLRVSASTSVCIVVTACAACSRYLAPPRGFSGRDSAAPWRSHAASTLASFTIRRKSAQQYWSPACDAGRTSGGAPCSPSSSRAPGSSAMYFLRTSRLTFGSGSFVFSQSSMRPLLRSILAIQCTFCPVRITITSPFWRCRSPRDVRPSIWPRRKRKMSEPRPPSIGRQPPMTMSASSMKTTEGAAAWAAAKTLIMSECTIISPTRKNLPFRRCASQRPTVVLPVPGSPCTKTPRLGQIPNLAASSGRSSGKSTNFSSSSLMLPRPGNLSKSTFSTSSGLTADVLMMVSRTDARSAEVFGAQVASSGAAPAPPYPWAAAALTVARATAVNSSVGESCEWSAQSAPRSTLAATSAPKQLSNTLL